jgi:radical SAM superfamily enzyme YgiQ (UPF0313 family)
MAKVMLVQPWIYHDEGVRVHDLAYEWRNGPYSLLILATNLKKNNHEVMIIDMARDLVILKGDVEACLANFCQKIQEFIPEIIGVGFFSVSYVEVMKIANAARELCKKIGINPIFIAGGIHASVEPHKTIEDLGFDYAFVGEADIGIVQLANGQRPETIKGIVTKGGLSNGKGEVVRELDSLPFPDWSLCDYKFYSFPSFAKLGRQSKMLDMLMGRGCINKCNFCAYSLLSSVRFYCAEYLVEQIEYMTKNYQINGIYFIDSSIGNHRRLLIEFCELLIKKGTPDYFEWYSNIRSDQVDEDLLKLMFRAGCCFLLYGFESGSQRILDLMGKRLSVEDNYRAVELHRKLKFPYLASMILGYPGESKEDILKTLDFMRSCKGAKIGVNCYVPLPGSCDYYNLRANNIINTDDPYEWRRIGEVNPSKCYANVPIKTFHKLFEKAKKIASKMPRKGF